MAASEACCVVCALVWCLFMCVPAVRVHVHVGVYGRCALNSEGQSKPCMLEIPGVAERRSAGWQSVVFWPPELVTQGFQGCHDPRPWGALVVQYAHSA